MQDSKFVTPQQTEVEKQALLPTPRLRLGPMAWCKRCHRIHRRRDCNLEWAERTTRTGRKVMRLVHPRPKPKARRKTKARKT